MARIGIDLTRRIGTVDRRIFGNFIEHLGRCIYGGIYEEGSPLSDAAGFRKDVLDAVRPLRVPVLRDRKSTRLNSSHSSISYAVFCLKKKKKKKKQKNKKKKKKLKKN